MIVRQMGNGQLLCIHQTSHALMAAEFCRHWGNAQFAAPRPYAPILLAVAQHDNGWYEWETQPRLCDDGFPMDFITYTDQAEKTQLWQRGIDRVYAQHPYAALLVSRHASILYEGFQAQGAYDGENSRQVTRFLAEQKRLGEWVRRVLGDDDLYLFALQPEVVEANTQLLQFGDRAALQVAVPWANETSIGPVPVDYTGAVATLHMQFDDETITFDPWPYGVDRFTVSMEGYLLDRTHFESAEAYHEALAHAPLYRKTWSVTRNA